MQLYILISLNPRKPELTIYQNPNGWGFSKSNSYLIRERGRVRIKGKRRQFNSSIRLATRIYDGIVDNSTRTEHPFDLQEAIGRKQPLAKDSILLKVEADKSDNVMTFINDFVKSNNLIQDVGRSEETTAKGSWKDYIDQLSFT